MKRRIRLTESDLHKIVKESVKKIIKEAEIPGFNDPNGIVSSINDKNPEEFENEDVFESAVQSAIHRLRDDGQEINLMSVIEEMGLKEVIENAIDNFYPGDVKPGVFYKR